MILVVGDLILDEVIKCNSNRISPEAPVPVLLPIDKQHYLGGAANVANNVKKLGEDILLIGIADFRGFESSKIIKKLLKKNLIKNKIFKSKTFIPPVKKRIFLGDKMICRLDYEKKVKNDRIKKIYLYIKKNIKKFNLLIISDYNKGTVTKKIYINLVNLFKKNKKLIICNPKKNNISYYNGCDIIVPNEKEFHSFFKKKMKLREKINFFFKKNNKIKNLIITRGGKNLIFASKKKINYFKVKKILPKDVTGASDTFISVLGIFLKNNYSIKDSIKKAIIGSGLIIKKNFTSYLKINEIRNR